MISERQLEQLTEILVKNIQEANTIFLENIGSIIKQLSGLRPTEAHQLIQILKYGGNFDDIEFEIARLLNANIDTIDKIFSEYAKKDQQFYEQFYKYRDIPFVPYEKNVTLRRQVQALANITKGEMMKYSRTKAIGCTVKGLDGKVKFLSLRETYDRVLDEAFLNVGQGKETFDSAMRSIMKQLGGSGLKTVDYASGRSVRLDSTVRMHLMNNLTELHNENQRLFGEEFDADGVEISVHELPAPDHAEAQGRQFSFEEYEKLQTNGVAKDFKGKIINLHRELKSTLASSLDFRPIGWYNCKHWEFEIILGVSKPNYTEKKLQDKIDKAEEIIDIDGKSYTRYECTQLQRQYERKIREQKDVQILARTSDDEQLIFESQSKITELIRKYREISEKADLPTKDKRLQVAGYRRVAIKE